MAERSITLGVVSDTHLPRFGHKLPALLIAGLREHHVEAIAHCGDMTDALAIPLLESIAPLQAVAGNNDPAELVARFGRKKVLTFGRVRIGMVHGDEGQGRSTPERALHAFEHDPVNVVLFGHSHVPYCERHNGVLLFNPGSPTDKRRAPDYTYGVIRISGEDMHAQLFHYEDRSP